MIGAAASRTILSAGLKSQRASTATASLASSVIARKALLAPVQLRVLHTSLQRYAANPQSGKPASDSWSHTKQNIKEEAKSLRSSIESTIAGGSKGQEGEAAGADQSSDKGGVSSASDILKDARSITGEMAQAVPRPALLWGSAGILPYVSTAAASIWLARQEHMVDLGLDTSMDSETASALLLHAQNIQVGFGAVLLSFLGAIHWGFEFSQFGGRLGNRRYAVGVLPLALGWPTMLLAPQMALIAQWAAFVAVWFVDLRATSAGWVPKWYSTYRFWLTFAVGTSIIATLAGTNYYAPGSRSTLGGTARKLEDEVKADGPTKMKLLQQSASGNKGGIIKHAEVTGDVEATSSGAEGDSYVKIGNPKRKEEERKEKEEEEKKKKEEEQKKKEEEQKKKAEAKSGGDKEKKDGGKENKDADKEEEDGNKDDDKEE